MIELLFSHQMLGLFDADEQRVGLDWTMRHVSQGFARTQSVVWVVMPTLDGLGEISLADGAGAAGRAVHASVHVASGRLMIGVVDIWNSVELWRGRPGWVRVEVGIGASREGTVSGIGVDVIQVVV